MTRTFQDQELLLWEVYAAAPRFGKDQDHRTKARMLFHCLTDPDLRARVLERGEGRAAVERWITGAGDAQLVDALAGAHPLD